LALEYRRKCKSGKSGAVVNVASVAGLGLKSVCPVYDRMKLFVMGHRQSISVSSTNVSLKYVYDVMLLQVNEKA
jgi:short-subunit dehydrogenase